MKQYLTNLGLWARGIRWLWTRGYSAEAAEKVRRVQPFYTFAEDIVFKPGWGPWRFLPVYLSTYLLGTLVGGGVVSISYLAADKPIGRLIDRAFALFGQKDHCKNVGPRLWGSRSAWE